MNIHIIESSVNSDLKSVTIRELEIQEKKCRHSLISSTDDPRTLLENLIAAPIRDGDVVCFAGLALRTAVWELLAIAKEKQINLMPGCMTDHRGQRIPDGKFFARKPQEVNQHPGIPYVMLIGDVAGAKQSWSTLLTLSERDVWSLYQPEDFSSHHWLSAAAVLHPSWLTPDWFPVVDLTVQDLELMPVMYATNHWSDWISFYPAGGNLKLENHVQTYPVWFDHSTKPLEYWGA